MRREGSGRLAYKRGVGLHCIEPGKPVQNAHVESFNGKSRDQCPNERWLNSIIEAQVIMEAWRLDYNTVRPHSSLGHLTPKEATKTEVPMAVGLTPHLGAGHDRADGRLLRSQNQQQKEGALMGFFPKIVSPAHNGDNEDNDHPGYRQCTGPITDQC